MEFTLVNTLVCCCWGFGCFIIGRWTMRRDYDQTLKVLMDLVEKRARNNPPCPSCNPKRARRM